MKSRLAALHAELGIAPGYCRQRGLPLFREGVDLVEVAGVGRAFLIERATARDWLAMAAAAGVDGVALELVSAFRSYQQQVQLVRRKLEAGQALAEILAVLAPPGCSEHHTGQALDIGTPGCPPVDQQFEDTAAFRWLVERAGEFGFRLSYPRDNAQRYIYEPWHWRHG